MTDAIVTNSRIDAIIDGVVAREAGFVDHPSDRGGPTNYGITELVARLNGYVGDMREMPIAFARSVYWKRYVVEPWFDRVADASMPIAEEVIDTGVVMGPATAAIFLQRWLNGFNAQARRYADLFVDGRIGPATLISLRAYLTQRGKEGQSVMVAALNSVQGSRFLDIAERDKTQEDFLYGWIRSRVLGLQ